MANKIYEEEHIRDIANAIREKNGTQNSYLVSEMGDAIRAIEGNESVPDIELTVIDSGVCGESAHWELYDNRTLYINGSGEMFDYRLGNGNISPFRERKDINKVIFSDEITRIGDYLLVGSNTITDIIIGNNVKVIGKGAFVAIYNIKNITLPDGLTKIEENAFEACVNLESIIIPSSIKTIELNVFMDCYKMNCIYYKGTKNEWDNINIDSTNESELANIQICYNYQEPSDSTIGVLSVIESGSCGDNATWTFYNDGRFVVSGVGETYGYNSSSDRPWNEYCAQVTSLEIKEGISIIGGGMFAKFENVENIIIPHGVIEIKGSAFESCSTLKYITIPNSVTTIGDGAFCNVNNLVYILYAGTKIQWDSITKGSLNTSLNESKLCCNYQTTYLYQTIEKNGTVVFKPENGQLYNQAIINVNVPQATTEEQEKSITITENGTTEVLPDEGKTISKVIIDVDVLSGDNGESDNEKFKSLLNRTISEISRDDLNGMNQIYNYLFSYCQNLTSITIPDSVTKIGDRAFYYCVSLTSVTIPDSVTTIGDYAFYNCRSLTNITISDSVTTIGNHVFTYCVKLTSVTIPDGVTAIKVGAFQNCISLTSITIPGSVTSINTYVFDGCNELTDIYLKPTTPPTLGGTSAISTATTTIHVPVGSGDAYKSATNWSSFADKIIEDPEI